jgi:Zn finger protein HypA/HybF involved in hydrogenase expression
MQCQKCGFEFEMDDELIPCPQCSSFDLAVVAGDEMTVDEIEFLGEETSA